MKRMITLISIVTFMLCGCSNSSGENKINLDDLYKNAVADAIVSDSSEIANDLIEITENNSYLSWKQYNQKKYVLALTLTPYKDSYKVNDSTVTSWGETWVTVVPEMRDFLKNYKYLSDDDLQLRVLQLLGMPTSDKDYVLVELWVDPDSLFRPSPDNEINDRKADLFFPKNTSQNYIKWFNDNILYSYFPLEGGTSYPWTRLGYTYDWAPKADEQGLSEFVIKKNTKIYVQSNQRLYDYIYNK